MTTILAIDPGPERSAWLVFADGKPESFGHDDNLTVLQYVGGWNGCWPVIEKVESFGMAVGAEVFETVFWSGRFAQAAFPNFVGRIGRKAVKLHLCGTHRAKDPNIRAALIDRWGGKEAIRKGGPLYGITGDVWAALAVAVAWSEGAR